MASRDAIEHEVVYPFPIDVVWNALTDSEQLAKWLMENDFTGTVGESFTFFDHEPWPDGNTYDINCEIVRFEPPSNLAYTWTTPPKHGRTLVEWELTETPTGTRVRLTHSGFATDGERGRAAHDLLKEGWGGLLRDELPRHLETIEARIPGTGANQQAGKENPG